MKSNNIVLATSLRDLAYSAFCRSKSDSEWRIFCRYRNKAKTVIRKERKNYFGKLFSGLDSGAIWKFLKCKGFTHDNDFYCEFNVHDINNYFVNASQIDLDCNIDFNNIRGSFSFRCVTEDELLLAIFKIKSKSIGTDGIPIHFIKIIFPYISNLLLFHVNSILTTSVFPVDWKTARIVPIPKSRTIRNLDDLRPISILPAISKVVEHILKDQILSLVNNQLSPSQYAFRRGHNTTSLLLILTDSIRDNINNNLLSSLVSLDLTKAFNSVNFFNLIMKLTNHFNFSKSACILIHSYLSGRHQFVDVGGVYSDTLPLFAGVPQGSVLGPLLFIMYVNDLPLHIDSSLCRSFIFADDVFLLFKSHRDNADVLESNINYSLVRFLEWSRLNSLVVNFSKTKAILFGNSCPLINISIDGQIITFVDNLKCLGIYLDNRLNFECHTNNLFAKTFGILRQIYSNSVYLPCRIRYKLAYALLMPHLFYGIEVVSSTVACILAKLNRLVNVIVRYVYKVRRWMHISEYVSTFLGCSFRHFVDIRKLIFFIGLFVLAYLIISVLSFHFLTLQEILRLLFLGSSAVFLSVLLL